MKHIFEEDVTLTCLTVFSVVMMFVAFFVPPTAVIDSSILVAIGLILGFGALYEFDKAVNKNLDAKIKIKELELEISNSDKTKD